MSTTKPRKLSMILLDRAAKRRGALARLRPFVVSSKSELSCSILGAGRNSIW